MKLSKQKLIIISFFAFSFALFSQNEQSECASEIVIDFNNLYKSELSENLVYNESIFKSGKCYLEKGNFYTIKITNINLNAFKVQETLTQENFNDDKPEILSKFKVPSFLNLSTPEYMENSGAAAYVTPESELLQIVKHYQRTFWQIKSLSSINYLLEFYKLNCADSLNTILTNINAEFIDLKHDSSEASINEYLKKGVIPNINKSIDYAVSFDELYRKYKKEIEDKVDKELEVLNKQLAPLTKIKNPDFEQGVKIRNLKSKIKILEEEKTRPAAYKTQVEEFMKSIQDGELFKLIFEIIAKRNSFTPSNFTYIFPFKAEKDLTKIELTISTDKELACNKPKKLTIKREYWTNKGLKIDFSAGIMVNGGNSDFIGNEYEYSKIDDTNSTIREKDGGSRALLSMGAFMHIYKRSYKNVKVAFSPGLSTNENFDGLIYHLGLSLLVGKKDRLVFTTGLSAKSSNVLDNNYKLGESYITADLPENPSTLEFFPKFGYFFSLSYNLSGKKSSE
jgi:hypothetical protein